MFEYLQWVYAQMYKIRWEMEGNGEETSVNLSFLNSLLRISYEILNTVHRAVRVGMEEQSLLFRLS
jgi:hypothetical protein